MSIPDEIHYSAQIIHFIEAGTEYGRADLSFGGGIRKLQNNSARC